jgi:hypothetical protein
MTDFLGPKSSKKYFCKKCDYLTDKKSQYERHILTLKHKRLTDTYQKSSIGSTSYYMCNCGKEYKHKQSLFTHKKKCNFINKNIVIDISNENNNEIIVNSNINNENNEEENISYKDMFLKVMNENKEMRNIILEQQKQMSVLIPKIGNITNNTTNNTTNNQNVNIQVFLNEQCKDAINMSDFIKSIEVTLKQLDFTKTNGLANGISKTILENMSKLSIYERPLHCTDIKRETLYIKEDNEWSKDQSKEKIKQAIKKASSKNYNALQEWKSQNPDFIENDAKQDYFARTISEIGKSTNNIDNKVIKNICKEIYIKDKKD